MFNRVISCESNQSLTEGERVLVEFLDENLKKDDSFEGDDLIQYNGWLIFAQPYLNGSRPDVIIFNPRIGVQIFEVKDWNLSHYFFERKEDSDKGYSFRVSDRKGTYTTKSPIRQVEHYKEKIVG